MKKKRLLQECLVEALESGTKEDIEDMSELFTDQLEWEIKSRNEGFNEGYKWGMFGGVVATLVALKLTGKI